MKIKVITIDFWNTLFDSSNGIKRNSVRQHTFAGEIAKLDVKVSSEQFQEAIQASWEFFNNIWMNEQRTPGTVETITYLWGYLKLPFSEESINIVSKSFAESILDYPPKLMDGAKETLASLKNKGYKIGLISDTGFTPGKILKQVMNNAGVLEYFDTFSFSDETGVSKPNPTAYTTILNKFDISPEFGLHIGDIEKTDIVGAKQIGMKAIRFNGDETAVLSKSNSKVTLAEMEILHWNEFEAALNRIENENNE
jgi:putative hydrolase of the HAD superfamily